jgi:8-oxo-dGTP diphosphatase
MSPLHRISAGALVVHDHRVLLVKQRFPGREDFWVPPGGGTGGKESLMDCAVRECFEETGLKVRPVKFVYIEEFFDAGKRFCKHWIQCELIGGKLSLEHENARQRDELLDARFFAQAELATVNVFPSLMRDHFWTDLAAGFTQVRHIAFES